MQPRNLKFLVQCAMQPMLVLLQVPCLRLHFPKEHSHPMGGPGTPNRDVTCRLVKIQREFDDDDDQLVNIAFLLEGEIQMSLNGLATNLVEFQFLRGESEFSVSEPDCEKMRALVERLASQSRDRRLRR